MITREFPGPGGKDCCSVMNCTDKAIIEKLYEVAHPSQDNRRLLYRFCYTHRERGFEPDWAYPNYELISARSL